MILAAIPRYPPHAPIGSCITTHELLAGLVARGHEVTAVSVQGRRPTYTLDGVEVHTGAANIERLASTADVMVCHTSDRGRVARAARAAGVPLVRLAHSAVAPGDLADGDLVVFNSRTLSDTAQWAGPSIVVHPPVDPTRYRTQPGEKVTLVNLSPAKGVYTLWKVAEQLPHVEFLAVRGGYGRQVAPRAANVEVRSRTVVDMRTVYSKTRVLLMPSEHETWGRVGVEAMASGIPVVAHPTPGLREALGNAAIFVDRDDIDGWARTVERLVTRPTTWTVASKAARRRSAALDPAIELDRFTAAVEQLVGGHR